MTSRVMGVDVDSIRVAYQIYTREKGKEPNDLHEVVTFWRNLLPNEADKIYNVAARMVAAQDVPTDAVDKMLEKLIKSIRHPL